MNYEMEVELARHDVYVSIVGHDVRFQFSVPQDREDDTAFSWMVNNMDKLAKQAINQILEVGDERGL